MTVSDSNKKLDVWFFRSVSMNATKTVATSAKRGHPSPSDLFWFRHGTPIFSVESSGVPV